VPDAGIFLFEKTPEGRQLEKTFEAHECKREDVSQAPDRIEPSQGHCPCHKNRIVVDESASHSRSANSQESSKVAGSASSIFSSDL
jgi:hypothetical protein